MWIGCLEVCVLETGLRIDRNLCRDGPEGRMSKQRQSGTSYLALSCESTAIFALTSNSAAHLDGVTHWVYLRGQNQLLMMVSTIGSRRLIWMLRTGLTLTETTFQHFSN